MQSPFFLSPSNLKNLDSINDILKFGNPCTNLWKKRFQGPSLDKKLVKIATTNFSAGSCVRKKHLESADTESFFSNAQSKADLTRPTDFTVRQFCSEPNFNKTQLDNLTVRQFCSEPNFNKTQLDNLAVRQFCSEPKL